MKVENAKLKEINETQHKLCKIFLEKFEKEEASKKKDDKPEAINKSQNDGTNAASNEAPDNDNEDDVDEDIDLEDSYQEWLKDARGRGFKRTTPSAPSENNREPEGRKETGNKKVPEGRTEQVNKNDANGGSDQVRNETEINRSEPKFCHFWNNMGKCTYVNCKFLHQSAPTCKWDGDCRRTK